MLKLIQKGFNYSQDGPGNRLVYHLQGCNMRCPWCSNPEGLSFDGVMMHKRDQTSGRTKTKLSCVEYHVEELVDEVFRSRRMFFEGGGVTFTGGEPTVQFAELKELMEKLKHNDIHIAMENNGTCPRLSELLPLIDYLIMDMKHTSEEIHRKVTGVSNKQILKNLAGILQSGRQVAIRIPLIHGFNDTKEALDGFLSFLTTHPSLGATLEILPYHEYGKEKWEECGLVYQVKDGFVREETVREFEAAFREAGIHVIHT